jgi:hypothetical protein
MPIMYVVFASILEMRSVHISDLTLIVSTLQGFLCLLIYYLVVSFQCHREGFIERVKEEAGEGCNIYGKLEVNKVAGNFHIAPGKSFQQSAMHLLDLMGFITDSFNVIITSLFLLVMLEWLWCLFRNFRAM